MKNIPTGLIGVLIILTLLLIAAFGKLMMEKGIKQGHIEVFTGQLICRQVPLQGVDIQLECRTRREIEDLLRFIQPKGDIK
jgi:hypothetical protein